LIRTVLSDVGRQVGQAGGLQLTNGSQEVLRLLRWHTAPRVAVAISRASLLSLTETVDRGPKPPIALALFTSQLLRFIMTSF
jgi:hypothetical protein